MTQTSRPRNYAEYLKLGQLLTAQERLSELAGDPAHDEMLFILVHQAYELWFKQIRFELESVLTVLEENPVSERLLSTAVKRLDRITVILRLLVGQIEVLETMSSLDFLDFRSHLGGYSGFQSGQFRLIEAGLGLQRSARVTAGPHAYDADLSVEDKTELQRIESGRNLFHCIESWLERTPFVVVGDFSFLTAYRTAALDLIAQERTRIDATATTISPEELAVRYARVIESERYIDAVLDPVGHAELRANGMWRLSHGATIGALLITLYRDEPILHTPYRVITAALDCDEQLELWRSRHALMVQRMLGRRVGTGGSAGFDYLRDTAGKHRVFLDLANLATLLIPRSAIPPLPESMRKSLDFVHQ